MIWEDNEMISRRDPRRFSCAVLMLQARWWHLFDTSEASWLVLVRSRRCTFSVLNSFKDFELLSEVSSQSGLENLRFSLSLTFESSKKLLLLTQCWLQECRHWPAVPIQDQERFEQASFEAIFSYINLNNSTSWGRVSEEIKFCMDCNNIEFRRSADCSFSRFV